MKATLSILLHYMHDFDEILETRYSKIVTNNDLEHQSYNARQHILFYLALIKLCSDELTDCKIQIAQLTSQVDNIFATLDESNPKYTKRGIIHPLFNFLFK